MNGPGNTVPGDASAVTRPGIFTGWVYWHGGLPGIKMHAPCPLQAVQSKVFEQNG